ncbi:hypothetical protein HOF78_00490 [Candidatus Woesearchaeota archaeon]|jgi:hypothetical protein|nr:hypothetical protein [Candidatus Woesearchaeota archaeon]MBT6044556.1 hypothetical protein [Candidatus Woesearchaeota archaeon]
MNNSKVFTLAILTALFVLTFSVVAEASYFTDFYGPRETYFSGADSRSRNSDSYSNFGNFDRSLTDSRSGSSFDTVANGYSNSNYGSYKQDGYVAMSDGYSFTKKPCSTRTVNANFVGKYGDYRITERVCDGISGDFYKSNDYRNNVNNNVGYNQYDYGSNMHQNNQRDNYDLRENSNTGYKNSGYTHGQSTSFGVGTRIIF